MKYWYKKAEIPKSARERIKSFVSGEKIGEIFPDNHKKVDIYMVSDSNFRALFKLNRPYLYRGDYTAPEEENTYQHGYNVVTESGLAGLYVTTDGWLISVFSNERWKGFVKLTADIVKEKVLKVVCIVSGDSHLSGLTQLYINAYDLKIIAATIDDSEKMTEYYGRSFINNFQELRGIPHHVFLGKKNIDTNGIKLFSDYFEAVDYVNSLLIKEGSIN